MALVVKDRVKQTTTTTGTGNIVLNGTVDGFQTFAAVLSNGDTTYYSIFVPSTNAFEVGLGTWTESTATLARTTVLESSNSGNAINITAQAEVFITYPAEKSVYLDASGDVTLGNDLTVTGDFTVNGTTTTINSTNKVLTDSLIELANGTTGTPSNDSGIIIERGDSDNAFIGYDESADKFTVGTGSFTGGSTGNLTISTGTLVANVEGNVTGNVTGSSGSTTGNAATATALETARTVGGVSFDGTANINLPGVNTAGNQNTSGNAATATILETARTIGGVSFNGSANINLPGVNTSGNQDTSGNAATATTAGTVTTAAQPNITSLGTLTTLTVDDITIDGSNIVFEGATADDFETTFTVTDPTADRTINLPDASGDIVVAASTSNDITLTSTDSTDGPIINIIHDKSSPNGLETVGAIKVFANEASGGTQQDSSKIEFATTNSLVGQHAGMIKFSVGKFDTSGTEELLRMSSIEGVKVKTRDLNLDVGVDIRFHGATSNNNETFLTVTDPTADRTVTIPDQTGTVMLWQNDWPDDPVSGGRNYAIGDSALLALTTGQYNVTYGYQAGKALTSGNRNVAIGQSAMLDNTTDSDSTAVGYAAGRGDLLTGGTYVGSNAGNLNSASKDYQVAIGYNAMDDCSGDEAVAIGVAAMSDGHHYRSVAIGHDALGRSSTNNPHYNVAVGWSAGTAIESGDYNTLVGYDAETYYTNTSYATVIGAQAKVGFHHGTSVGYRAGYSMFGQSDYCTLIGNYAGYDLDGGDGATYVGYRAGYGGGSGTNNTGIGRDSLYSMGSGGSNTAVGLYSGYSIAGGGSNTCIGVSSGYSLTNGDQNTFLGLAAGRYNGSTNDNATTTGDNNTCVGAQAVASSSTVSNEVVLGNSSVATLRCNVQTISSLSDERDKTAIEDLPYGLNFINDMRPVQFTWNRRDGSLGAKPDMGFIAQDLYDVELDHSSTSRTRLVNWENPEKLEADYMRSYPILVKAVQELSAKIDALTTRVAELEGE